MTPARCRSGSTHTVSASRSRSTLADTDVMGKVDMFAHKNDQLDGVRGRFGVVPVRSGI